MQDTPHVEWLKKHCNRYLLGACWSRPCVLKGGGVPGHWHAVDAENKATCIPHEIIRKLERRKQNHEKNTGWKATYAG